MFWLTLHKQNLADRVGKEREVLGPSAAKAILVCGPRSRASGPCDGGPVSTATLKVTGLSHPHS